MKLVVSKGAQHILDIDLKNEVNAALDKDVTFVIGRSPNAIVHLDDKQVSREHGEIRYEKKRWILAALQDKTIKVNDKVITLYELQNQDLIEISPFTIKCSLDSLDQDNTKIFHFNLGQNSSSSTLSQGNSGLIENSINIDGVKKGKGQKNNLDLEFTTEFQLDQNKLKGEKTLQDVLESVVRGDEVENEDQNQNQKQNNSLSSLNQNSEEVLDQLSLSVGEITHGSLRIGQSSGTLGNISQSKISSDGMFDVPSDEEDQRGFEKEMSYGPNVGFDIDNDILGNVDHGQGGTGSHQKSGGTQREISLDDGGNEYNENNEQHVEEGYSLENIDNSDDINSGSDSTQIIKSFASIELVLYGELAPYDRFFLENGETYIGRDSKKCQIVLNDPEVSTVHAVIRKNNITCSIEDLNSSNGTLVNGEKINKISLTNHDEILIGSVSFTVKVRSEFIKQESKTLLPVENSETVEVIQEIEIPNDSNEEEGSFQLGVGNTNEDDQEKSIIKRIWKNEEKRKKAIYAIVLVVGAWFFFSEDNPNQVSPSSAKKSSDTNKESKENSQSKAQSKPTKVLSPEERKNLTLAYQFGRKHFLDGRYREAITEFEKVVAVDPNFNDSIMSQLALAKDGLKKIEELERKKQQELESIEKRAKVESLLKDARQFVEEKRIEMAELRFSEIILLDPDNIEVPRLKLDIETWKKEIARKDLEETQKKSERASKVQKLNPGKTFFSQKEWYKAIIELEKFLKIIDMDDDLRKEAETMHTTAKTELESALGPLVGKAKSLLEGQDIKGAYETYIQILKINPTHAEAINQTNEIKDLLTNKARKIYREAIISESLSLFQDAKEKFQEVQQISPVDSEYYKKATDKLRNYLE